MAKRGIKETLEILEFGLAVAKFSHDNLTNGIGLDDVLAAVGPARLAGAGIEGWKEVDDEIMDLDEEEEGVIIARVQTKFPVPNERAKSIALAAMRAGFAVLDLWEQLKTKKA